MSPNPDPIPGLRDGLVDAIAPYERRKVRRRAIAGIAAVAAIVGTGVVVWPSNDESTLDTADDGPAPVESTIPDTVPATDPPASDPPVPDPGLTTSTAPGQPSACVEDAIAARVGGAEGAAGTTYQQIVLTNIGGEPCVLSDMLEIQWSGQTPDGSNETLFLPYGPPPSTSFPAVDGTLGRGESAAIVFPHASTGIGTDPDAVGWTTNVVIRQDGEQLVLANVGVGDVPALTSSFGLMEPYPFDGDPVVLPSGDFTDFLPGQTISTVGLGSIVAGSTMQEVADATGSIVWAFEWGEASPGCGHAVLGGLTRNAVLLHLLGDSSDLDDLDDAIVSAVVTRSPEFWTPSGIRVGSPEADVLALGADRLTRIDSEYDDSHTWRFTPADPAEQHLGVAFTIVDGSVTVIAGGQNNDVYRLEGCA